MKGGEKGEGEKEGRMEAGSWKMICFLNGGR